MVCEDVLQELAQEASGPTGTVTTNSQGSRWGQVFVRTSGVHHLDAILYTTCNMIQPLLALHGMRAEQAKRAEQECFAKLSKQTRSIFGVDRRSVEGRLGLSGLGFRHSSLNMEESSRRGLRWLMWVVPHVTA